MFVQMVVDGQIDAKRRHRPEAGSRNLVVFGANREIPGADASNTNQASDRYHPQRSVIKRLQHRILFTHFVALACVVGGDPSGGGSASRGNGRPVEASTLLVLGNGCRRKNSGDKQSCRKNLKRTTGKHAATIGRNVLLL